MKLDDYELEKCIGKGVFGQVYLTSKKGSSTKFATKEINREEIEKTDAMKYLRNELVILQYLNHPNIVKFQDVKKTKKNYYIIMEYCNGGELAKALEKYMQKYSKPFPEEIVQHIMKQIISAFKYIHERKIIHGNVKLQNILLHYENEEDKENLNIMKAQVKVIDFGFACKINKTGLQYSVVGNPINFDPLILKKLNSSSKKTRQLGYNESADIWSIGSICYEMLIGRLAFDAEDMEELVKKVEIGEYSIPTTFSHEAVSFLNGMLQYEAKNRLTAEQLSRHDFLTKDVKSFKPIDLQKVSKNVESGELKMNANGNESIWAIFNDNNESLLTSIQGSKFIHPNDEKEELAFNSLNAKKSILKFPTNGIPDNEEQKVSGMSEEELKKMKNESNYVFNGNIFDN